MGQHPWGFHVEAGISKQLGTRLLKNQKVCAKPGNLDAISMTALTFDKTSFSTTDELSADFENLTLFLFLFFYKDNSVYYET